MTSTVWCGEDEHLKRFIRSAMHALEVANDHALDMRTPASLSLVPRRSLAPMPSALEGRRAVGRPERVNHESAPLEASKMKCSTTATTTQEMMAWTFGAHAAIRCSTLTRLPSPRPLQPLLRS